MMIWQNETRKILLLVTVLSLAKQSCSVFIETGDDLVSHLCDKQLQEDAVILLNASIEYNITGTNSCVVNNNQSIVLKGNDAVDGNTVVITCINKNISFAFVNTSITISGVTFVRCGAMLSYFENSFINSINSSSLYFSESHSSVFIFINSNVSFTNVEICDYYGFALIGINLKNDSEFNNVRIKSNIGIESESENKPSPGSGVLLLFTNDNTSLVSRPEISITNTIFTANFEFNTNIENKQCAINHFKCFKRSCSIINAAALTVIFNDVTTKDHPPLVSIRNSSFTRNTGSYCSGLMIIMLNSTNGTVRISENTTFKNNNNYFHKCPGSALVFYAVGSQQSGNMSPLLVYDARFQNQDGLIDSNLNNFLILTSTAFIGISHSNVNYSFVFERVKFLENAGDEFGTCLSAAVYDRKMSARSAEVSITLRGITAKRNKFTNSTVLMSGGGIFAFADIDKVVIDGSPNELSCFQNNEGSVIYARNTPVYLAGFIQFFENKARSGAVLAMSSSLLYFTSGLNFVAINNHAESFGGVVHSISTSSYTFELPNCALQFPSDNITIRFSNNSAMYGGSSIFVYPLYSCYNIQDGSIINLLDGHYEKYLNVTAPINSTVNIISTLPYIFNRCSFDQCDLTIDSVRSCYYPGQTIPLCVNATSYHNGTSVYATIRISLIKTKSAINYIQSKSEIRNEERVQYIIEKKGNNHTCTLVNITLSYHDDIDYKLKKINESQYVALSSKSALSVFRLNLSCSSVCPLGFHFNDNSGTCECSRGVKSFYHAVDYVEYGKCYINFLAIARPLFVASPWLGNISEHDTFGITDLCPFDFCTTNLDMSYLKYNTKHNKFVFVNSVHDVDSSFGICRGNRIGTLCGECDKGYSVVFGSGECMQCSNWWLLSIAFYAVIGPLLIFVLYTLNLTLTTGTINGIIFYGQAAEVSILPFLSYFPPSNFSKFTYFFLSILNINLGFPMCFYNGMDEFWKTGLSLVFPIYLLAIVFVIILLSRCSTKVSNRTSSSSIQVLVTVIHMSVSKLLGSVIDVFIPIQIHTDKNIVVRVWYRNGTINFNSPRLYLLMAFTVVIVASVLLPYFTLLIGGRWLLRFPVISKYCRAGYEAIHGPYKENRRFWFLARIVLLIIMYAVYSVYRGSALHLIVVITLSLLIIFLVLQEYLKPFKNKFVGTMDSLVIINLIMAYILAWHQANRLHSPNLTALYIVTVILVSMIIIMSLLVLGYHALTLCQSRCSMFHKYKHIFKSQCGESTLLLSDTSQASFYQSCHKYREPVIDFD